MNETELKNLTDDPRTKLYYEVTARDLWYWLVDNNDEVVEKVLKLPTIVRASLLLKTTGDNYNYFENCIHIAEMFRPGVKDTVNVLETACYFLIDNKKINHKIVVTVDDIVKGVL